MLCLIIVIRFCSNGFFVHSTSNQESGAYFMEKRKPTNPIHSEIWSYHCMSACRVNTNTKHTNSNHCPKCSIADFTSSGLEGRNSYISVIFTYLHPISEICTLFLHSAALYLLSRKLLLVGYDSIAVGTHPHVIAVIAPSPAQS